MRRLTNPFNWVLLLSIIFCVGLVTDLLPILRGDLPGVPIRGLWIWNYDTPRWAWVVPCIIGLAIYLYGGWHIFKRAQTQPNRYPVRLILWTFVGAALLPILLMSMEGSPLFLLFTRSVSPGTGGYQYAAVMIDDMAKALREWPDFVSAYRVETNANPPGGVVLSPPGLTALYYGQNALLSAAPVAADALGNAVRPLQCQNLNLMTWTNTEMASTWFQIFMPLWGALGVAPLYQLAKLMFDGRRAQLAILLWPLVPGMTIFTPRFNVFYALLTVVILLALWRGIVEERARWLAASGFMLSMGLFFNISLVPLGLMAGLFMVGYRVLVQRREFRRLAYDLILFGIGSASVWLIYWALAGQAPHDLIRFLLNQHYDLYRPYLPWVFLHPYDMFLFVGVPITLFAGWRIGRAARASRRESVLTPVDVFAGAGILTIAALALSGTGRGETGRVWLFFAPVWILLAVDTLAALPRRAQIGTLVLQALCLLSMAAVIRGNFTSFTEPHQAAEAHNPTFPVHAQFQRDSDQITLVGLDTATTSDSITLRLHWRADRRVERPYVLALISIGPDGQVFDNMMWNPANWDYPPSCWTPGREFADTVQIDLGENPQPGAWTFSLSILDAFTQETMTVVRADGTTDTQVGIGPITVPARD